MPLMPDLLDARLFAHVALACYVIALLARKDMVLRLMLLLGTAFYILYYFFVGETPLWDAIFASVVIGLANIYGIVVLLIDRTTLGMSQSLRDVYAGFPTLNPGQFRRVMRLAEWHVAETETVLCSEGTVPRALFFTLDGPVLLQRGAEQVAVPARQFVGEVSFILGDGTPASATVTVAPGARYVAWDRQRLGALVAKSAPLANAFGALFNHDIARKLTTSWPMARG